MSEEQATKDKAILDSMRNARANMGVALERIDKLEKALRQASEHMTSHLRYVPESAYLYKSEIKVQDVIREHIAAANAVL